MSTSPASNRPCLHGGAEPRPSSAPARGAASPVSIHIRAVITWLAIFPLVSIGMIAAGPLMENWHPILRALFLTLMVVPTAVYVVVPKLLGAHMSVTRRRAKGK